MTIICDDALVLGYKKTEEFAEVNRNGSAVFAAFVTAYARLELLGYLEKLGTRCLYYDTDSVLYVKRPGDEYVVPEGNFLGEMKNEIETQYCKEAYASEWVIGGPKNYAFKVKMADGTEKYELKVRGLTQSIEATRMLNFEHMKEHVFKKVKENEILVSSFERCYFVVKFKN